LLFLAVGILFSINSVAYSRYYQVPKPDSLRIEVLTDSSFNLHDVNFKDAVTLCNSVLEQARAYKSPYLIKNALYTSAYLDWFNGDHLDALVKTQESLALSKLTEDTLITAENFTLRGLVYLYLSDYDSSLNNFAKALTTFKSLKDTAQTLRVYGFIGLVYNKQSNYIKARENLMEQVVLKRQFDSRDWNVIRFDDNANHKKYFEESLVNAYKNLKNYPPESSPSKEKRFAYRNIALIYREFGNKDSVLFYFKKSVDIANKLKADAIWFDLAKAYLNLGLYDSATWANEKGINVAKKHGTRIILNYCYMTKGHILKAQKKPKEALRAYSEALKLDQGMGHKNAQMKIMITIATTYLKLSDNKMAFEYADSALFIAKKIGARKDVITSLNIKLQVFKALGDYKNALKIKELYDVLLDSLQKGQIQLNLAKLDLSNEVELDKLEISDLNKQQKLAAETAKYKNLIILIIILVAIFSMLLLAINFYRTRKLVYLNKKLKSQQQIIGTQNQELFKSNKEKEILLGEIHHRVKNNLQTIASLLSIQKRKLKDPESIKVLADSQNRVMAMGLIHQHLYQNASFAEIDFKNYTRELIQVLISTNACFVIDVKCRIPLLKIDLDNAIFFGLIVNELAINSIKHAYEGVLKPLLEVSIFEENNKTALLIKDNGNKEHIDFDKSNSFGWKMVNNICDKLEGQLTADTTNGLAVKILFNKSIIAIKSATN